MARREETCCFTGHRPAKLPWGEDERDPRCIAVKRWLERQVEGLYRRGWRHFISGMALGGDTYFAEAVLELRGKYPDITLEAAVPCRDQARGWSAAAAARREAILTRCDRVNVLAEEYSRGCMHSRDRYMVDASSAVLALYDGSGGGTGYTVGYALRNGLEISRIDPRSI